jgi:hypothetical protein
LAAIQGAPATEGVEVAGIHPGGLVEVGKCQVDLDLLHAEEAAIAVEIREVMRGESARGDGPVAGSDPLIARGGLASAQPPDITLWTEVTRSGA